MIVIHRVSSKIWRSCIGRRGRSREESGASWSELDLFAGDRKFPRWLLSFTSGSKPSHSTKRSRLLCRGTTLPFSHSDAAHRFLPMTPEELRECHFDRNLPCTDGFSERLRHTACMEIRHVVMPTCQDTVSQTDAPLSNSSTNSQRCPK